MLVKSTLVKLSIPLLVAIAFLLVGSLWFGSMTGFAAIVTGRYLVVEPDCIRFESGTATELPRKW